MNVDSVPRTATLQRIERTLRIVSWLSLLAAVSVVGAAYLSWISDQSRYAVSLLSLSVVSQAFARRACNSIASKNTRRMAEHLKQFVLYEPGLHHGDHGTKV